MITWRTYQIETPDPSLRAGVCNQTTQTLSMASHSFLLLVCSVTMSCYISLDSYLNPSQLRPWVDMKYSTQSSAGRTLKPLGHFSPFTQPPSLPARFLAISIYQSFTCFSTVTRTELLTQTPYFTARYLHCLLDSSKLVEYIEEYIKNVGNDIGHTVHV